MRFEATPGASVTGEFEEERAWWVFPQPPTRGPLASRMEFHRYWINGLYSVRVRSEVEATAIIE